MQKKKIQKKNETVIAEHAHSPASAASYYTYTCNPAALLLLPPATS
jgi:hypothetical protein